jgi:molybdate transport system ATP-binding protein
MIDVAIQQRLGTFELAVAFRAEAPVVGLFGRSGSGKTSVINAIAGITHPESGSIVIDGTRLFDSSAGINLPPEARRIAYVFQDDLLFPHLNVRANLQYGLRLRPPRDRFIDQDKVIALLGLEGLLTEARLVVRRREAAVAIGRALLAQPRIMLLDEPLAALDSQRKSEILRYIERLRDQLHIPIIYVSHSVEEVMRLTDTVVILAEGKCIAVGKTAEVLGRADMQSATDGRDVGSVIEANVVEHDVAENLTTLAFDGGRLLMPLLKAAIGDRFRARVSARDVSLALVRPYGISILNVLPARVAAIHDQDHDAAFVDVQLAIGNTSLTARITRRLCASSTWLLAKSSTR